jgi:RNA polymerase sigma-70 factor (ECF subfamily)
VSGFQPIGCAAGPFALLQSLTQAQQPVFGRLLTLASAEVPAQQYREMADTQVVSGIARGDQQAFHALLAQHADAVFAFLCRRVRPRETAEDLFQETWIHVIQSAGTFRGTSPVRPWLYRIALNVLTDHHRKSSAQRRGGGTQPESLDAVAELGVVAPDHFAKNQEAAALHDAVERLPEAYREVVRLRYFEELSTGEVAAVLDCAEGTVKSRLSRGLALLQQEASELR